MSEPNYSAIAKDTMLPRAPIPLRLDTSNLHGSILGGRQGCVHAWVVSCLLKTLPAILFRWCSSMCVHVACTKLASVTAAALARVHS